MLSRLISRFVLPLALFAVIPFSHAAVVQDRVAAVSSSSRVVTLHGNVSGHVKRASDLGSAPQDRKLESLSLRFSMTPAQQADLTQLLAAQLNSGSPSYHKWLTPEQFGTRFGLSSGDLAKVSTWLTSQGFAVTGTARSSTFITFSGTVAQAQQAFGTSIHSLSLNGEQHIANMTDPVLPSAIAGVVTSITGLNDFKLKPRSRSRNAAIGSVQPQNTQTINGQTSHFIAPGDFYTIYDLNPLITSGINGTGVTIAVMGQTDLTQGNVLPDANITAFRTASNLPAISLKLQPVGTDPGISAPDIDEAHIDVEWSGAAAPGANILYVYGVDVFDDSLTYAIDNKVAPIITISYGNCESNFGTANTGSGPASVVAYNQLLAMANAEGITVMSSSGDSGATDCDDSGPATEGLSVDFPSSSPFVTSAGGTMFSADVSSPGTYWSSTNGSNAGSALSYIAEQPWNETTATAGLGDGSGNGGGAGGGGASAFFAKPSWQVGLGVPNDSARDVPDISLNAAADHDGYLVCSSGSSSSDLPCSNGGFLSTTGVPNVFGGTSFVAPTFAGILALLEQKLGLGGTAATGLGNINPILYGLANGPTSATIFHDTITGNNAVPCSQGTPNCSNADPNYINGSIGYNAGTGYDQASGLGSVDVNALVKNWASAVPTGTGGSTNGTCPPGAPIAGTASCISATTLTTSGSLCAITSGSLALSVTVAGSISGVVPTGSVQFFVDNKAVGTPVNLANGTAAYTLVTTAAGGVSSGGHNISAVYSGDGNYVGSKGTLLAGDGTLASVDVVSTTTADFSITPCTGSASVAPNATASGVTFTVTPFNGFTGSVNMIATNNNSAEATTTFSLSPVTITSATGVTTSFVFKASTTSTAAALKIKGSGHGSSGRTPWYAAGSGATLACMILLTLPRRRRWGALLAAVLSVAALTAVGCSNTSTSGNPAPPTNGTTPTPAGTYTYTITAIAGSLVHSTQVTVTVQ